MSEEIFKRAEVFLPKYLTPTQKSDLYRELRAFPNNMNYYLGHSEHDSTMLQGDGWKGFIAIDFRTRDEKTLTGIVLSNSCDIFPENPRRFPINILFAPIIKMDRYKAVLTDAGQSTNQINDQLNAIRMQNVTQLFYLPELPGKMRESIVVLDDIHSHPREDFIKRESSKVFTLSQYAFYLFLIKLSIHLCRFNEGIARS